MSTIFVPYLKLFTKLSTPYGKLYKNKKLYKKHSDEKIDNVAALMDAFVAYKLNKDAFD